MSLIVMCNSLLKKTLRIFKHGILTFTFYHNSRFFFTSLVELFSYLHENGSIIGKICVGDCGHFMTLNFQIFSRESIPSWYALLHSSPSSRGVVLSWPQKFISCFFVRILLIARDAAWGMELARLLVENRHFLQRWLFHSASFGLMNDSSSTSKVLVWPMELSFHWTV